MCSIFVTRFSYALRSLVEFHFPGKNIALSCKELTCDMFIIMGDLRKLIWYFQAHCTFLWIIAVSAKRLSQSALYIRLLVELTIFHIITK